MVDKLFEWADKDISRLYQNLDRRDFVLWVVAFSTRLRVMLTYTRLYKLIYLLQNDLKGRLPEGIAYRFGEFHFGPYDSELQADLERWSIIHVIEHIYQKWKQGSNVPTCDVKITSFGEDYVNRISEPRLMNALGTEVFEVFRTKTSEYLRAKESDLIISSWEKWIESQTDENKKQEAKEMLLRSECKV